MSNTSNNNAIPDAFFAQIPKVDIHCHLYGKFYTPFQPVSIHACPYMA